MNCAAGTSGWVSPLGPQATTRHQNGPAAAGELAPVTPVRTREASATQRVPARFVVQTAPPAKVALVATSTRKLAVFVWPRARHRNNTSPLGTRAPSGGCWVSAGAGRGRVGVSQER